MIREAKDAVSQEVIDNFPVCNQKTTRWTSNIILYIILLYITTQNIQNMKYFPQYPNCFSD